MRHQIRAMLHQLAENGRLGSPDAQTTATEDADMPERPQGKLPGRIATNLKKAQAAAQQQG